MNRAIIMDEDRLNEIIREAPNENDHWDFKAELSPNNVASSYVINNAFQLRFSFLLITQLQHLERRRNQLFQPTGNIGIT